MMRCEFWQIGGLKSSSHAGRLGEIVSAENELQRPVATSESPAQVDETAVERWLRRGRNAIPQNERDENRADWMYRKMEAFARRFGERLSTFCGDDVLDYLTELTRRGHTEWQFSQALDSICILLAFGCGRKNVRMGAFAGRLADSAGGVIRRGRLSDSGVEERRGPAVD